VRGSHQKDKPSGEATQLGLGLSERTVYECQGLLVAASELRALVDHAAGKHAVEQLLSKRNALGDRRPSNDSQRRHSEH